MEHIRTEIEQTIIRGRVAYHHYFVKDANKGATVTIPELYHIAHALKIDVKQHGWYDTACYAHKEKWICLPLGKDFRSSHALNNAFAHEIAHAFIGSRRGKDIRRKHREGNSEGLAYALEEVLVELTAQLLMEALGNRRRIRKNSNAYIFKWLRKITKRTKLQLEIFDLLWNDALLMANKMLKLA